MSAPSPAYTVERLAPDSYDVLYRGAPIASLVRNPHQEGLNDAWMVELLDDVPAAGLTAPFTARRHLFRSLLEVLQWLGITRRRAPTAKNVHQGPRKSPVRRGSLSIRDRYQLRLLALHDRFYSTNTSLKTLEQREFIAPTGRTDGRARVEWAITDAGRLALAEVE